jgi:hypothetical protein
VSVKISLRAKILIGVALSVVGYIVLMPDDSQTVEPAHEGVRPADPAAPATKRHENAHGTDHKARSLEAALKISDRLVKDTVAGALFTVQSWYIAPPAPPPARVVVQAPPPPSAPPLPFAFMGSYKSQDGNPTFFLTAGDRVYDVKVGDTLDNTYSVDGVKSGQLLLTYMPLKIQQSLAVGTE